MRERTRKTDGIGKDLLRTLEQDVARALERRGDGLDARHTGHWVSFRSRKLDRVFAELRPHAEDVEIFLLPPPEELQAVGRAGAAPPTQGWGWFKSKLRVRREREVADTRSLLLRSYEARRRMSQRSAVSSASHGRRARKRHK